MKLSKIRRSLYRAGAKLGDIEALSSGNPEKMLKRESNKIVWRGFGSIFRMLGGKK